MKNNIKNYNHNHKDNSETINLCINNNTSL